MIVFILLGYGVMVAIGNTLGGRWANQRVLSALTKMFAALAVALAVLAVAIISGNAWFGLIAVLLLGFFAFMNVPGLQLYVVQLAEEEVPNDISLTSSFNISAFNIGITVGSLIGAQVTQYIGINYTPLAGIVLALLAMIFTAGTLKKMK